MTNFVDSRPMRVVTLEESVEQDVARQFRSVMNAAENVAVLGNDDPESIETLAALIIWSIQPLEHSAEDCRCSTAWFGPPELQAPYWEIYHRAESMQKTHLYTMLRTAEMKAKRLGNKGPITLLAEELKAQAGRLAGPHAEAQRRHLKYIRTRFLNSSNPACEFFMVKHSVAASS